MTLPISFLLTIGNSKVDCSFVGLLKISSVEYHLVDLYLVGKFSYLLFNISSFGKKV